MPTQPGPGPTPPQVQPLYNPFAIQNLFMPMSSQIDQQTAAQINQLKEQFGSQGMRWSRDLAKQMSGANMGAAQQKNQLLSDLMYNEAQNAYNRQLQSAQLGAQREQQLFGQKQGMGDLALRRQELLNSQRMGGGNLALQMQQLMNQQRAGAYDMGAGLGQQGMQQANLDRQYRQGLMNDMFGMGLQRGQFGLQLGQLQDQRDQGLMMDLMKLGMGQRGMDQAALDRQYQDWMRKTMGSWDLVKGFVSPGGYSSDFSRKPGWLEQYGPIIASLIGSYAGS